MASALTSRRSFLQSAVAPVVAPVVTMAVFPSRASGQQGAAPPAPANPAAKGPALPANVEYHRFDARDAAKPDFNLSKEAHLVVFDAGGAPIDGAHTDPNSPYYNHVIFVNYLQEKLAAENPGQPFVFVEATVDGPAGSPYEAHEGSRLYASFLSSMSAARSAGDKEGRVVLPFLDVGHRGKMVFSFSVMANAHNNEDVKNNGRALVERLPAAIRGMISSTPSVPAPGPRIP